MISPIILLPFFGFGILAQYHTTFTSLNMMIFLAAPSQNNEYVGSVVEVADNATVYAIACTSGSVSCAKGNSVRDLPPRPAS